MKKHENTRQTGVGHHCISFFNLCGFALLKGPPRLLEHGTCVSPQCGGFARSEKFIWRGKKKIDSRHEKCPRHPPDPGQSGLWQLAATHGRGWRPEVTNPTLYIQGRDFHTLPDFLPVSYSGRLQRSQRVTAVGVATNYSGCGGCYSECGH